MAGFLKKIFAHNLLFSALWYCVYDLQKALRYLIRKKFTLASYTEAWISSPWLLKFEHKNLMHLIVFACPQALMNGVTAEQVKRLNCCHRFRVVKQSCILCHPQTSGFVTCSIEKLGGAWEGVVLGLRLAALHKSPFSTDSQFCEASCSSENAQECKFFYCSYYMQQFLFFNCHQIKQLATVVLLFSTIIASRVELHHGCVLCSDSLCTMRSLVVHCKLHKDTLYYRKCLLQSSSSS